MVDAKKVVKNVNNGEIYRIPWLTAPESKLTFFNDHFFSDEKPQSVLLKINKKFFVERSNSNLKKDEKYKANTNQMMKEDGFVYCRLALLSSKPGVKENIITIKGYKRPQDDEIVADCLLVLFLPSYLESGRMTYAQSGPLYKDVEPELLKHVYERDCKRKFKSKFSPF